MPLQHFVTVVQTSHSRGLCQILHFSFWTLSLLLFFFLQVCEISWQQLFFCLWVSTTSADARVIHSDVHAKFKKHGTSPRLYLRNHASSLWLFPLRRTKQAYPRELRRTLIEAKEMAPLWSVVRGLELTLSKKNKAWMNLFCEPCDRQVIIKL